MRQNTCQHTHNCRYRQLQIFCEISKCSGHFLPKASQDDVSGSSNHRVSFGKSLPSLLQDGVYIGQLRVSVLFNRVFRQSRSSNKKMVLSSTATIILRLLFYLLLLSHVNGLRKNVAILLKFKG